MEASHTSLSSCRSCRYYTPEGQRGGNCSQLNVPVKGGWKACRLTILTFSTSWEEAQKILVLPQRTAVLAQKTEVFPESVSVTV